MKKKQYILLIYLFALVLIHTHTRADNSNLISELYTTEHGLSSTKISSITQDHQGFIWIGTEDGLNKFDGYQFQVYKKTQEDTLSLASNHITSLFTDSNNRLWIGTIVGLQYYDSSSDSFISTSLNQPDYVIKNNQCLSIYEDKKGNLWFATSGLGVLRYNPSSDESLLFSPSSTIPQASICGGYIRSIAEDKQGNMWFASQDNGLSIYNPTSNTFTNYNTSNSTIPANNIFSLQLLDNGNMMISTIGGGVFFYNAKNHEFHSFPQLFNTIATRYIYCALQNRQKELLLGTEGNGLMIFDPAIQTLEQHPIFQEYLQDIGDTKVHNIYEDNLGNIWIGMNYKGLCVIKKPSDNFLTYRKISNKPNSLSFGHAMGVAKDQDGEIWIATDGGGLNRYNPINKQYTSYKHEDNNSKSIPDNAVVSVLCDSKNRIWAGTYIGGLCLFDKKNETFTSFQANGAEDDITSNYVRCIIEDKRGFLWIATSGGGLNRFDTEKQSFRSFKHEKYRGLIDNYITKIFIDSRDIMWIGTFFGLSCMDIHTETFTSFGNDSGLSSLSIYSIAEDKNGDIWIGTQNGLNKYNPEENKFETITINSQWFNLVINGIIPYQDQLWISTNNGIVNFTPSTGAIKQYTKSNGLQGNEFILGSYYKSEEGEFFFGGINGFNSFYPDKINSQNQTPQVYITSLKIFNQTVPINKKFNGRIILKNNVNESEKIKLKHSDKSFTLEFTAPTTAEPTNTFYLCKMEGFDKEWIQLDHTRRFRTYTNLNPGTYVFQVKASNNPDIWSENSTSIIIEIEPPIWATWWARLGYILIIGLIIGIIFYVIIIRIRDKNELRIERLKVKQQEEISQEKMQFFTNISHEFRTPLTLIIGPLERLLETENDPEKKQTELMMLRNAERLLRLINQILELRKAEKRKLEPKVQPIDLIQFISDTLGSFSELADNKNITLTYTWNQNQIIIWYDPDMLDKCIYNILSNAFKFTPAGGKVKVDIQQDENQYVFIRITDTGIGIKTEDIDYIFERFYQVEKKSSIAGTGIGLHLTKNIIDLHHGNIIVDSDEGKGTTFCITIRPGNKHFKPEEIVNTPYQSINKTTHSFQEGQKKIAIPSEEDKDEIQTESNITLLLVEDDNDMRQYVKEELKNTYHIIEAKNGKFGLAKAIKYMPDLIITDVMMPEMSGIELCRSIKQNTATSHIPVIILTAQSDIKHRIEGLETGADSYISKPFNSKHLRIRIEKLIELRQTMKERFSKSLNMEAHQIALTSTDEKLLQGVIDHIRENIENPELNVESMSKKLGMSRTHLHRKLKALSGQTPIEFIRVIRMKQAAYLLSTGKLTIAEVGYKVGYSTPSYFSSSFNSHFGMSPTVYMEKNKKEIEEN